MTERVQTYLACQDIEMAGQIKVPRPLALTS